MKSEKEYAVLVGQAAKAVDAIKDPSLKQIAFQKVLDDLISASEPRTVTARKQKAKGGTTKVRGTARGGPTKYVQELIGDGFFNKKQRTIAEVRSELGNRGHHIPITSLSGPLQGLCKAKALRRQKIKGSYQYSEY